MPAGRQKRRGSVYVLVLGVGMVLTVIGLAAISLGRIRVRTVSASQDWLEAQALAFSAAEHALVQIEKTEDWRGELAGKTIEKPFGRGTFRWQLVDPEDGDLTDDTTEPVTLLATGLVHEARYALALHTTIEGVPLEALRTCIAAGGDVQVKSKESVTLTGGALSSNKTVDNKGEIYGDVEAESLKGKGKVSGTVTTPTPPKAMPNQGVFDSYKAKAVQIPFTDKIEKVVLGPANNPWGSPSADGLYYLDTGGKDLHIKESRIHGTLVVKCAPKKVILEDALLLHNYRSDYPVLIVDGDVDIKIKSRQQELSESACGTNFNPPGAPYEGGADGDQADSYPNEIRGLVHVTGKLTIKETARLRGTVICEGDVKFQGDNEIIYEPAIYQNPPAGYTDGSGKPRPDTWTRVVD